MDDLSKAIADSVASMSSEDKKTHLIEFLRPYIPILPISTEAIIIAGKEFSEMFGMELAGNLENVGRLLEESLKSYKLSGGTFNQDRRGESGVFSSDASLSANDQLRCDNAQLQWENAQLRRENEEHKGMVHTLLARLGAAKHACTLTFE